MARSRQSEQERAELLEAIKADFDDRLARLATDPDEWVTFLETVAEFGAQYTLNNQFLLLWQAEQRQMTPTFFLPFGNKAGTSGWKKYGRRVRAGEKAFYVWAPIRRRPTEDEAARSEAAGRKVIRDEQGRPVVQVVGFHLSPTFDLSQTDGEPFEVPTVQRARRVQAAGGQTPQLLDGEDPTGVYHDLVKLITAAGYAFELAAPGSRYLGRANGVTVTGVGVRQVLVRDDVSPAQRTKTTMHDPLTALTVMNSLVAVVPVRKRRAGGAPHPRRMPRPVLRSSLLPETKGRSVHGRGRTGGTSKSRRYAARGACGGRSHGRGRCCGAA
jgi:hypothetical protein